MEGDIVACRFIVRSTVAKGRGGGAVYRAESIADPARRHVALKYPASHTEMEVLQALNAQGGPCLGVPKLLSSGFYKKAPYVVTGLLGGTLDHLFSKLDGVELEERWPHVRLVGRMMLRRLEALHRRGWVHGDVAPGNVLFGDAGPAGAEPLLVDFGSARCFPNGEPVKAFWSTVEFTSVRTVDDIVRHPYDDLESLAYVLCYGIFGELPWFRQTRQCTNWEERRDHICQKIRKDKANLMWGQWSALGYGFIHLMQIPPELGKFLLACGVRRSCEDGLPDYEALHQLLLQDEESSPTTGRDPGEEQDQQSLRMALESFEVECGRG